MNAQIIRLIARRVPWPDLRTRPDRSGLRLRWDALTEAGEVLVAATTHPFFDGALALIQRGADPDALVTMRLAQTECDSFVPLPLRVPAEAGAKRAAKVEAARNRLRRAKHHETSATTGYADISATAIPCGDPLTPSAETE